MTKVARRLQTRGRAYEISFAVCADGCSPAAEFLDDLAAGAWQEGIALGDSALDQVADADMFVAQMKRYAKTGELGGRHQINGLGRGIWEFKVGAKRLSFFDTDGLGGFTSRGPFTDQASSDRPTSKIWHMPTLERRLRLADGFPKRGQTTPSKPINWAHKIRKEDVEYDKAQVAT